MHKNGFNYLAVFFFLMGVLAIILGNVINNVSYAKNDNNSIEDKNLILLKEEEPKEDKDINLNNKVNLKLTFIGDSLIGSLKGEKYDLNFQDLLEKHDYSYPYRNVKEIFESDDYTIANGENVFTDEKLSPVIKNYEPAYWYYTNSKYANVYKESSIEVVSVMNNHTHDYGYQGYLDTIEALKQANVIYGGEDVVTLEKDGIKIALLCTNLFHDYQAEDVNEKIQKIKNEVNYIIIYFHGGNEYMLTPSEDIREYAKEFIDLGADLVIGCHPHVLEPIETYKGKKIVYSLGSFLFGGTLNFQNRTAIYQVDLEFDIENNQVKQEETIIPCYLYSGSVGYDRWLPGIIEDETEKQQVLDFMNGLRDTPY